MSEQDSSGIVVARVPQLDADAFVDLLRRSGLAARRPADEPDRIAAMAANANLTVTARHGEALVGIARSVTDFAYCCYCSDLAVDRAYQGRGIGRRLIEVTRACLHPQARFLLVAAPDAVSYYEHIGMARIPHAFRFPVP